MRDQEVVQAARTGELVDARDRDPQQNHPEQGAAWGADRCVSAQLLTELLIDRPKPDGSPLRRIRIRGARIVGELNLEAATLACPLELVDCYFDNAVTLNEVSAASIRLPGAHVPAVYARQLVTRGDLDLGDGFTATGGVDLHGAHIGGRLRCTGGRFSNPGGFALMAAGLTVDQEMLCSDGFRAEGEVNLAGATVGYLDCGGGRFHNPQGSALVADGLTVDRDMRCNERRERNERFSAEGQVSLQGATIGGQLNCGGGLFSNPGGVALMADTVTVQQDMLCTGGFVAEGQVSLIGAHVGGNLECTGGRFSNSGDDALVAENLRVDQDMFCDKGFAVEGRASLLGAHVAGQLECTGGHFSNAGGEALVADNLRVDQDMFCSQDFRADGRVSLIGAHVGGNLECTGGRFSNADGEALVADNLQVDQDMFCDNGFTVEGRVSLLGAHVVGQLDCTGGHFSNPGGTALNAEGLIVGQDMTCLDGFSVQGRLSLAGAQVIGAYRDVRASWPPALGIDRFVYGSIDPAVTPASDRWDVRWWRWGPLRTLNWLIHGGSIAERLEWLALNTPGYSPQIYEQLAGVYRRTGRDEEARKVAIAKQRRRRAQLNLAGKAWNVLLHWTVGYGYRTWQAGLWLLGLLAVGSMVFGAFYPTQLTPAHPAGELPPFHPLIYTLDLLLPVVTLHQRDAWIAQGAAQWWVVGFTLAGWILTSAVVLSLSGILRRD